MPPLIIVETPPAAAGIGTLPRSYERGVHLGTHVHREAQLLFAASGVMQVTTPKGRWLVPPQRAVWLPARLEHAVDALSDIEMRSLYIEPGWLAAHPKAPQLAREFVVAVRPLLRELVLSLFAGAAEPRHSELQAQLLLFELIEAEDGATFMPMPNDARARRVAEAVLADTSDSRPLADLAQAAGASARTMTRLFAAETQLTFKEWRQRARIMASIELLSTRRASVKQVAARLGFSSTAAFGHAFRQIMGTTPSEFAARSHTGQWARTPSFNGR
ncbi:MAG TPA: helix-turn-helix transcriptional regulator [Stellaceae bacterium]|nr:helix-turn-helix transcriptional regulator [Stellaceae bacterium]